MVRTGLAWVGPCIEHQGVTQEAGMSIIEERVDPQAVRSRAHGRGFLIPLLAAWPVGVCVGLVAAALGMGLAGALASSLSVALGLNFVWVVIVFAIDDGHVDERVRASQTERDTG